MGLAADLQVARDFDRGMTGPPLATSMDFIAGGLVDMVAGLAQACVLFGFAWWAPPVLAGAWLGTHWLQKLALARGFMRDEPLVVVLDEPTAALDAETEHQLFGRYASKARQARRDGGVTILVSHRFSTVRMADLIVVLDGARVAETGSHDELMARDGRYADLYRIQAGAYQ